MESPSALAMEFADSEIQQILWQMDDLHIVFSAMAVTRYAPGEAPVSGFLQGVELVLYRCTPSSTSALFGRMRAGRLHVQGHAPQTRMSIPTLWTQPLSLELEPAQAGILLLQAQGLECRLQTGGFFRESLFC